jgi:hypothetical protein
VRQRFSLPLFLLIVLLTRAAVGQSPNGTMSGLVLDPSGRAVPGAELLIVNDATGIRYPGATNGEGIYAVPNLPPGPYRIQVSKMGFKTLIKPEVVLNVQDALAINFTLSVGAVTETVTVQGGAPLVKTESGSVGTVIDRRLVENLPLNGRTFNSLLQLTPGVVIAQSSGSDQGQYSVAGQRTSSNNFIVDGASANFGVASTFGLGTSGTGSAQAFSALGGTNSLVSVEALQEFRIETSSFAPEFGRSSGGQVFLTTRSGTNDFHGGAYEYFRNDVLDANDWFAQQARLPRAPERHNDFGAFFGGPLRRDKTFVFASYEGVRLRQPSSMVIQVPSEYARSLASPGLAPFLKAYPQPDDRTVTPGVYTASFTGNYSNPSSLNAGSLRIDHNVNGKLAAFVRYNEAPSSSSTRTNSLSNIDTVRVNTRTITLGLVLVPSSRISDSFRANYSQQKSSDVLSLDSLGGATPPSSATLAPGLGAAVRNSLLEFVTNDTTFYGTGPSAQNRSTQWNFGNDLALTVGLHELKFGADYRANYLDLGPFQSSLEYLVNDLPTFLANGDAQLYSSAAHRSRFLTRATSVYAQDTWKIAPRLTATYGLRWELDPAPVPRKGTQLSAFTDPKDLANFNLTPNGSPLWKTSYANFAPRVGAAYRLTRKGDLVLRGGWGMFYDLASDATGYLGASFPNYGSTCCSNLVLPVTNVTTYLASIPSQPPYPDGILAYAPNLDLPRSYQWNLAMEKSFADRQALSVTYVAQAGRKLLKQVGIAQPNVNFLGSVLLTENEAHSNYSALQVQYRRPFTGRVQALVNYTWSHSLDDASSDTVTAISKTLISSADDYGSSSFDARHSFSAAVMVMFPGTSGSGPLHLLTNNWSVDALVVARTGFPFNATVLTTTLAGAFPRPNRIPDQPVWIADPASGGGKRLNPSAFEIPPASEQGTERRNDIRGFGLTQADLSLARKFAITDRFALQFRADAFNALNHPNFRNPYGYVGIGPAYLQSPSMANVGLGGLNPLFQQGGPRSLQLSLKLSF